MNKGKKFLILSAILVCSIIIGIIGWCQCFRYKSVMGSNCTLAQVVEFANDYYQSMKEQGTEISVEYTYFKEVNAFDRQAYIQDKTPLSMYDILSVDKINSNLYAITYEYERIDDPEVPESKDIGIAYNYVAIIEGRYKMIVHSSNIPEDLLENFDATQYSYDDSDIVDPNDIL